MNLCFRCILSTTQLETRVQDIPQDRAGLGRPLGDEPDPIHNSRVDDNALFPPKAIPTELDKGESDLSELDKDILRNRLDRSDERQARDPVLSPPDSLSSEVYKLPEPRRASAPLPFRRLGQLPGKLRNALDVSDRYRGDPTNGYNSNSRNKEGLRGLLERTGGHIPENSRTFPEPVSVIEKKRLSLFLSLFLRMGSFASFFACAVLLHCFALCMFTLFVFVPSASHVSK